MIYLLMIIQLHTKYYKSMAKDKKVTATIYENPPKINYLNLISKVKVT